MTHRIVALALVLGLSTACAGETVVARVLRVQGGSLLVEREGSGDVDRIALSLAPEAALEPGLAPGDRVEVSTAGAPEGARWVASRVARLPSDPDLSSLPAGATLPASLARGDSRGVGRALVNRVRKLAPRGAGEPVDLVRNSAVIMRVPLALVTGEDLARRGLLNQHQAGRTGGRLEPEVRARIEDDLAMLALEPAYDRDAANPIHEIRPKYAFLVRTQELETGGENYGSVRLAFRPEVKRRSTWTKRDSLSMVIDRFTPPLDPFFFDISPLRSLYTGGLFPDFYKHGQAGTFESDAAIEPGWSPYSEVQIWGKLELSDVETVFVRDTERAAFDASAGARYLKSLGVPVRTCER